MEQQSSLGGFGLLIVVLAVMFIGSFIILGINGVNIYIKDPRISRNELAEAFKQRDQAIMGLAKAMEELQIKKKEDKKDKK